ncbi:hypothetical protein K435DRAFT_861922 [Dendrothele bispora CBS 962.96]|uniref:Uncharacterized protein n=1 Tax=Dendrothele bispora (strain CBS 962.96) TaxID=1314807 RepID=A0A4S8LV64_DENBC|nr:hypothetical protein K435DRAFT_861922 [Dendrothele bispora CBS 962.96]
MAEQLPPPDPNQDIGTNTSTTQNTSSLVLEPLKPLGQQIFFFQPNETHVICPEQWVIPTLRPYYKIGDDEEIHEQQRQAIQLAIKGLGMMSLENASHLTRSQYKTRVLKDYFSMLDQFLTNFKVTETKPGDSRNSKTVYEYEGI